MIQARLVNWLPFVTGLFVLSSLALAGAPVTWHLLGSTSDLPDLAVLPDSTVSASLSPIDIAPVLAFSPFGRADTPLPSAPDAAPPVDMVLLGIINRDDPQESISLINVDGVQANYKSGNKIGDDVILDRVNADHVVLLVGDTRRILGFPNADPIVGAVPAAIADGIADRLAAALAPPAGEAYTEPPPPPAPVTTRDYIDLWRARITANPKQVLDEIGLVAGDGGYTVAQDHDSGVTRAGLKAGDLVKSVNGQPVGDVDRDRVLYDEVADAGLARVEIERDGRSIVLSFPLQ